MKIIYILSLAILIITGCGNKTEKKIKDKNFNPDKKVILAQSISGEKLFINGLPAGIINKGALKMSDNGHSINLKYNFKMEDDKYKSGRVELFLPHYAHYTISGVHKQGKYIYTRTCDVNLSTKKVPFIEMFRCQTTGVVSNKFIHMKKILDEYDRLRMIMSDHYLDYIATTSLRVKEICSKRRMLLASEEYIRFLKANIDHFDKNYWVVRKDGKIRLMRHAIIDDKFIFTRSGNGEVFCLPENSIYSRLKDQI